MFNPFKRGLEKAYGTEKDVEKQEKAAEKKIDAAEAGLDDPQSGDPYGYKLERKAAYEELGDARKSGERLDYYSQVKKEVGSKDADVLARMLEEAKAEDAKRSAPVEKEPGE